ncbi:MAG TPA: bacterial transcriptional activator domain-containing protein, partial [Burkholderiaceae bacterium]
RETGADDALAVLLIEQAPQMYANGDAALWRTWLSYLPPACVARLPWLQYWQGVLLQHLDTETACDLLLRAAHAFDVSGEVAAHLLVQTTLADCYLIRAADDGQLPRVVAAIEHGLKLAGPELDKTVQLRAYSRLCAALWLTIPHDPLIETYSNRAAALLGSVAHPAEQLAAGMHLLSYVNECNALVAQEICGLLAPIAEHAGIPAEIRMGWILACSYRRLQEGRHDDVFAMLEQGEALARTPGLEWCRFALHYRRGLALLATQNLTTGAALLEQMRAALTPGDAIATLLFKTLEASYLARLGDARACLASALAAHRSALEARVHTYVMCKLDTLLMCCYAMTGDRIAVAQLTASAYERAGGSGREVVGHVQEMIAAHQLLQDGDEAGALDILRDLLPSLRRTEAGVLLAFITFGRMTAELCALALNHGVETALVRELIARHGVPPPQRACPVWPWPIAIRSFGKLAVAMHGQTVNSKGKIAQRPLRILMALMIAGRPGIEGASLARRIWAAGDQKGALKVTVHRLRKLLGHDEAIAMNRGQVYLSHALVWTDTGAFDAVCAAIAQRSPDATIKELSALASALFDLYRGPFCDGEDEDWIVHAREQWRAAFLLAADTLGLRMEALGAWTAVHKLYMSALAAEPLNETAYRGLMRCAHAKNDSTLAFSAYRQCREILASVADRKPSPETEALAVKLGLKQAVEK